MSEISVRQIECMTKLQNYTKGYEDGGTDAEERIIGIIDEFVRIWNHENSRKISYLAKNELVEHIRQQRGKVYGEDCN